ncbi:hypothetical protein ACVHNB_32875 [Streptomyces sp. YJ-C3]
MTVHGAFRGNVRDSLGYLDTGGRPDVFHRANLPRIGLDDVAALASGVMTSVDLWLNEGDLVTNLSFLSAGTAAGTPTNYWFALYDPTGVLLSQSADQLTAAWAADTWKTLALGAPQRATRSGRYRAAVNVTATTPPTLAGTIASKPLLAGEGNLAQTSGSSLTGTAPGTIATPAFKRQCPLVIAT